MRVFLCVPFVRACRCVCFCACFCAPFLRATVCACTPGGTFCWRLRGCLRGCCARGRWPSACGARGVSQYQGSRGRRAGGQDDIRNMSRHEGHMAYGQQAWHCEAARKAQGAGRNGRPRPHAWRGVAWLAWRGVANPSPSQVDVFDPQMTTRHFWPPSRWLRCRLDEEGHDIVHHG